nr:reverse transcriptase domain-containing protein [Tanacetum cinerariifolium]
ANPRGDLKEITTRSGVSYDGPPIPPPVVEREPEATKDKVQPTCPKSTTHVQPPVIQTQILNDEHVVAPKPKPSIPYPSRLNKQKLREKDDSQMLKFLQIFRSIHFDLPFADALLYMSKFAATFKSLLNNKENIFELANTPLNENCSVVLLKKLPEKLGDPDKPIGVAEDVFVKVGTFHFSADFVVVDYNVDPRVPLIIGRTFLRTAHALIDVHGEELMLRFNDEAITFTVGQTSRYSSKSDGSINRIDVIDEACKKVNPKIHEVIKKEVIKLLDAGLIYHISDSPWVSPVHCVPKKSGMTVVTNEDNELIPTRLVTGQRVCIDYQKLNDAIWKDHFPLPFMDQMLERLAGNEFYFFLDGFSEYFQILIGPQDQEKTTFTCPYGTFPDQRMPFGLCNAPGTFQRCMMAIFYDMIEETMEV